MSVEATTANNRRSGLQGGGGAHNRGARGGDGAVGEVGEKGNDAPKVSSPLPSPDDSYDPYDSDYSWSGSGYSGSEYEGGGGGYSGDDGGHEAWHVGGGDTKEKVEEGKEGEKNRE